MAKWQQYTKEEIKNFLKDSYSERAFVMKMGYAGAGGNTHNVVTAIKNQYPDLDFSHFTGQLWNKGKTKADDNRIVGQEKYTLDEVFIIDSPVTQKVLRGYVERHNIIPHKCAICGCDGHWQDGEIALEIHHINGINTDNRIENLQYLCPNCHALTDNYRGLNKKKS